MTPPRAILVVVPLLGLAGPAAAQLPPVPPPVEVMPAPPPRRPFHARGTWLMSGQHGMAWSSGSSFGYADVADGANSGTFLRLRPSVDHFVIDHLAIGFSAGFVYGGGKALREIGTRIGAAIPLKTPISSLWPRVGITLAADSGSTSYRVLQAYLPLVGHPFPHFFFAVGPAWERIEIRSGDGKTRLARAVGVMFMMGGYWHRKD